MPNNLRDLRIDYTHAELTRQDLTPNPITLFEHWLQQAVAADIGAEPNAMTLATATKDGIPSARIVLLKGLDERGFVFYTNYEGQKGRELNQNPHAALLFYWGELHRQVRVTGQVQPISQEESEAYFRSRPLGSQLGAWASQQSQVIENRQVLEEALARLSEQYDNQAVPRPPFWGGYRLSPQTIEFWQGRLSRLHDRFRYTVIADGEWIIERLSP